MKMLFSIAKEIFEVFPNKVKFLGKGAEKTLSGIRIKSRQGMKKWLKQQILEPQDCQDPPELN
ncbi:hypothetical protein ACFL5U_01840 [Candidatus Margulisiibacteriota bacterium]